MNPYDANDVALEESLDSPYPQSTYFCGRTLLGSTYKIYVRSDLPFDVLTAVRHFWDRYQHIAEQHGNDDFDYMPDNWIVMVLKHLDWAFLASTQANL